MRIALVHYFYSFLMGGCLMRSHVDDEVRSPIQTTLSSPLLLHYQLNYTGTCWINRSKPHLSLLTITTCYSRFNINLILVESTGFSRRPTQ